MQAFYLLLLGFHITTAQWGEFGGVSIVTVRAVDAALRLPAVSIALLVKLWLPSTRVAVANVQAPLPLAVAVPIRVAPSNT